MSIFLEKIKTAYENAYKSEYGEMKAFTKPKIYHGGEGYDLSKRWYVYYSYINPETEVMTRQTPIYLNINRVFKTKKERLNAIKILRKEVEAMLKEGYSPYEKTQEADVQYTIESCLTYALNIKKASVTTETYEDYSQKLSNFLQYLRKENLESRLVSEITKQDVIKFLNIKMKTASPSTRNSYRRTLSALFSVLEVEEYIPRNFIQNIPNVKATPKKNRAYTTSETLRIFRHLEHSDKDLLLLIKFVSYCFLRPVEVCRLQVKDVDLDLSQLSVRTKTKSLKIKRIPTIMLKELKHLDLSDPNAYFITAFGVSESNTSATDRRRLFTKRYRKVREKLGFNSDYTLYSFRHTFITKLYRELRKTHGKFETYDILMGITGHDTINSLLKYLREIDAELPEDWSGMIVID